MMEAVASESTASTYSGEDSGVRLDISSCVGTVEADSEVRQRWKAQRKLTSRSHQGVQEDFGREEINTITR